MAAAAEAMRIRRNISVLLLPERKARTPAHRVNRDCPKPRVRELRGLDLDQTNLTVIYVNDCFIDLIHVDAAIRISRRHEHE
jgi:hypothetical protein